MPKFKCLHCSPHLVTHVLTYHTWLSQTFWLTEWSCLYPSWAWIQRWCVTPSPSSHEKLIAVARTSHVLDIQNVCFRILFSQMAFLNLEGWKDLYVFSQGTQDSRLLDVLCLGTVSCSTLVGEPISCHNRGKWINYLLSSVTCKPLWVVFYL